MRVEEDEDAGVTGRREERKRAVSGGERKEEWVNFGIPSGV